MYHDFMRFINVILNGKKFYNGETLGHFVCIFCILYFELYMLIIYVRMYLLYFDWLVWLPVKLMEYQKSLTPYCSLVWSSGELVTLKDTKHSSKS